MAVCPVCEHQQAHGAECEVCGKHLVQGPAAIARVALVEGFEPTLHAPVDVEEEPTPGIEPTLRAPVDVEGAPVDGLEHLEAAVPGDVPTAVPAVIACRYCRTPAPPGERICGRCGMRLPVFSEDGPAREVSPPVRCGCGGLATGTRCPSCGGRIPSGGRT